MKKIRGCDERIRIFLTIRLVKKKFHGFVERVRICAQSRHSFQRGGVLPDISNADVSVHSQFCAKCDSTRRADICRHPRKDAQISQCEVKRKSHNLSILQIVSRVVARRRSVSCAKREEFGEFRGESFPSVLIERLCSCGDAARRRC